jgi:hypothetical protein
MEKLGMSDQFSGAGNYTPPARSAGTKAFPIAALALLFFAIGSLSGCTGIAGAPKTATTPVTATLTLNTNKTSLSFSTVNIGGNSTLPVILTNGGSSNVTISTVIISGAGYTAGGVSSGQILTPGQTATLNVTFAPAATGLIPGSVTVASDATNSPTTISLSGSGSQLVAPSVVLSWNPSTSAVAGYNVYRSQISGGPYTRLDSSVVSADSYTDSSVQPGLTYYYVVTSVTSAGMESVDSTQTSATVPTS